MLSAKFSWPPFAVAKPRRAFGAMSCTICSTRGFVDVGRIRGLFDDTTGCELTDCRRREVAAATSAAALPAGEVVSVRHRTDCDARASTPRGHFRRVVARRLDWWTRPTFAP